METEKAIASYDKGGGTNRIELPFPCLLRGKAMWGQSEKAAIYKQGRQDPLEANPVIATLILEVQPPEMWENKCLLFKFPSQ